jgi:glutathione S-transferase
MRLYIGNKNYSSWSLRPWLVLTQSEIDFEEVRLRFDGLDADSAFKREASRISPTGRVPVLEDDGLVVWDTLAIVEYLAERFPDKALWPRERHARARARSLCAEMHSGFVALRTHFPMNIELSRPEIGPRVLAERADVRADLARIDQLFCDALAQSGGPFLFGEFGIADAFFAPVAARIRSYGLLVSSNSEAYVRRIFALPAMQAWVREALDEHDFFGEDEPYRSAPVPRGR